MPGRHAGRPLQSSHSFPNVPMPSPSLESSLVRILLDELEPRQPVGAGFLVTPQHILTCAHVVNTALRRSEQAAEQPAPAIKIFFDFPLLNSHLLLRAKICQPNHWLPPSDDPIHNGLEDITLLELTPDSSLPAEALAAPLVSLDNLASVPDHRLRMCGFPNLVDQGTYIDGILKGKTGAGAWEIHPLDKTRPIEQGFSGTAVWAVQENAICGMIRSKLRRKPDQDKDPVVTGYMIPASLLVKAFPELDKHSRPANPYRGLEAFREKDANLYFGREQTITRLQQVITDQPFTAVIGASGSGKSSVVFAGVIPALRQNGDWLIAHCRPKNQPLYELATCLIPLLYDDPILRSEKSDELREKLHAGSVGLTGIIRQIREKYEGQYFLLIIDQFEELFTLNSDTKLIRQYIDLLLECLNTEHFTVLFTMRADFFAAAVSHSALAQALDSYAPIILPQLDEQGLREVVEQPAKSFGVRFEAGLTDLIIRDVGQEPGSLPLLEFCLTQLWERQKFRQISHNSYKAIGGVQQALANHADAVYAEFSEQEREQLRHIFLKLVRPGQGTEDTRQVANLDQIRSKNRALITQLADKRLIVTGRDEERRKETVEVVHEALIRRWQTLRQWVDEERKFLVWQEKLQVLLGQWEESKEDEGALLRGLPLDEALKWRGIHENYLECKEKLFILESEKARKKQRWLKIVTVSLSLLTVMIAMVTIFFALRAKDQQKIAEAEKEQQILVANYNLAKTVEEKALRALKRAEGNNDVGAYKEAVLFASTAMDQQIDSHQYALSPSSIGRLFSAEVFQAALSEIWDSPVYQEYLSNACFSPDGKMIAFGSGKNVHILNSKTKNELMRLKGHSGSVSEVAYSPDGKVLASASSDQTVRLWDTKTGERIAVLHEDSIVDYVSFSPDGRLLASVSNIVRLRDSKTGEELLSLPIRGTADYVSFSPDSRLLAWAYDDQDIRLWNIETGKEKLSIHTSDINCLTFSPDGNLLALASSDKTIRLIDSNSGKEIKALYGHTASVDSVSFSPDEKHLASSSFDKTVRLWDIETGKPIKVLRGHTNPVGNVSFSPDGRVLASTSYDKTVRLWNITIKKEYKTLEINDTPFWNVTFNSDGKLLAASSSDNSVRIWNIEKGEKIKMLRGHTASVRSVSFSPGNKILASGSDDKTIRLWSIKTDKEISTLKGHTGPVRDVIFTHDGRQVVSTSLDRTIRTWDYAREKEINILKGHTEPVSSVSLSLDGKILASASWDKTIRIWDYASGKEINVLKGHTDQVNTVSFSPKGNLLASASRDKTVRIWNINTTQNIKILHAHDASVSNVSFNSDGNLLASASLDNTIRLWDTETWNELTVLRDNKAHIRNIAFNANGLLASASGNIFSVSDAEIKLWDTRPYMFFQHHFKPTTLYNNFITGLQFLWKVERQGLKFVPRERTPEDIERFGTLLTSPPQGQSKFNQILHWAETQQNL